MQISTFAINYQGLPFREPITKNKAMYNSLVGVSLIAFAAAAELSQDLNDWMQLVPFPDEVPSSNSSFGGSCWRLWLATLESHG
jgi:manganese-transporting P-type ATPase